MYYLYINWRLFIEKNPILLNSIDNLGRTPLHYACAVNDPKQIEILIANKADEHVI